MLLPRPLRIIVTGGRCYQEADVVHARLDELHALELVTFLAAGEAEGADTWAREWALSRGVPYAPFPALWREEGRKRAGIKRNHRMFQEFRPNLVVGFPGGRGTADMLAYALSQGCATWEPLKPRQLALFT